MSKSRPAVMNMFSDLVASSSSAASSPIASKSLGMSGASGKLGSKMNLEASSFDAASASQVRLKDAYLGGLKEKSSSKTCRMRTKKLMILNLSRGVTSLLLELTKLVGDHMQEKQQNPSLQRFRKVNKSRKRQGTIVFNYRYPQINLRMLFFLWSRISLGKTWRIHGRSECAFGHLENVHVHCVSSIHFYRQRKWRELIWIEEEVHQ